MGDVLHRELFDSFNAVPLTVAAARLIAAFIAAIIGIEREWRAKPAGLRTHILVAVAACLFVVIGQELGAVPIGDDDQRRYDPLRLIEAVKVGVAFLAAGLIFTSAGEVRNVTTGASIWLAGAIGLACGAGQIPVALFTALLVVAVLSLLGALERRLGAAEEDGS